MDIKDETINERRITAAFSQQDIEVLLINKVAKDSGIQQDRNTKTSVRFWHEDKGTRGFEIRAEIKITTATGGRP